MDQRSLHTRMLRAVGDRSIRQVGELTGTHPETVRRFLGGGLPSAEFLAAFCAGLRIDGDWLLTGRGSMRAAAARPGALDEFDVSELLTELGRCVERLAERVDQMEVRMLTLEVLALGRQASGGNMGNLGSMGASHGQSAAVHPPIRVTRVADVLAERPRAADR